jgi:hypothetical protein
MRSYANLAPISPWNDIILKRSIGNMSCICIFAMYSFTSCTIKGTSNESHIIKENVMLSVKMTN